MQCIPFTNKRLIIPTYKSQVRHSYFKGELYLTWLFGFVKLSTVLADANISIFAVLMYDTDYILLKEEKLERGLEVLRENNYEVVV